VEWPLAASLALVAYTYVGYPLLATLLAALAARPHRTAAIEPSVSLIILAHNEEAAIGAKLENTLALDYPADRLEIVVASDGSTDRTDEIVHGYAPRGVRLVRAPDHPGKTETTNRAAAQASGEILVFSDATGAYSPGALRALVRSFADPAVGAVSGRVVYDYPSAASAQGFRAYQRIVVRARRAESVWGTETSVSGSICAVRRDAFEPLPRHLDFDMAHPLHAAARGLRTVYEPDAISREEARSAARSEFDARVRMALFAFGFIPYAFARMRSAAPSRNLDLYVFQFFSHKLMRWLAPLWLMFLAVTSVALAGRSRIAALALAAQLLVYASAAIAYRARLEGRAAAILGVPLFFVTLHWAFAVGLWRYARGQRAGAWRPERPVRS
jgi:cellulose synthase/poly-beta-1,6-N-acetylglucosamine synthase-like glycosyltransferase